MLPEGKKYFSVSLPPMERIWCIGGIQQLGWTEYMEMKLCFHFM